MKVDIVVNIKKKSPKSIEITKIQNDNDNNPKSPKFLNFSL